MARIEGFTGEYRGLTNAQAAKFLEQHGYNELEPPLKQSLLRQFFKTITEPMFLLLLTAATLYLALGELGDGLIMLVFVAVMAAIELVQEYKTDKTLEALRELSSPRVRVLREGSLIDIESRFLAVGDLMLLEEGQKIAADGEILEQYDLGVDQSALTGESEVVYKTAQPGDDALFAAHKVYQGTLVISGTAIVRVTATGRATVSGQIGKDVAEAPDRPTPLEKQTHKLIQSCGLAGAVMLAIIMVVTYLNTGSIVTGVLAGITLAMGIIPEEFPVILTVFLSLGALRLAKRQSLVRKLPSVETLGAISVLCVDKTGTLTENRMEVCSVYTEAEEQAFWRVARLACELNPYDPMEQAIARRQDLPDSEAGELVFEYSFSSETKMMGHLWQMGHERILCAKGSPEAILPLCGLDETQMQELYNRQQAMAQEGQRVIAVAYTNLPGEPPPSLTDNKLTFLGLIGFADPPRQAVPAAVAKCVKAGIRVVMITGDNPFTAQAIGRQVGIISDGVITGDQIEAMTTAELEEAVGRVSIFARVAPRHKMAIVTALKARGETVAMTGDGVNDAPALKYADIGIAMGGRGTSVAREAADMVLLDDNFTTIVETVADGRRIYDNIRKAFGYVLVVHIPVALLALWPPIAALISPALEIPLLLFPVHIVILELIIDPTCSIIFERQPPEINLMERPPRQAQEPLVDKGLLLRSVVQGLVIFGATLAGYLWVLGLGQGENAARSMALTVLVLSNLLLVYVNMSNTRSAWGVFRYFWRDKVMWLINLAVLGGLALLLYLPAAASLVRLTPLPLWQLGAALCIAAAATLWYEPVKKLRYGKKDKK